MPTSRSFAIALANLAVVFTASPVIAQEPRPWEIDDLYLAESFHPIAISPDGKVGAAVHNWIDPDTRAMAIMRSDR